MREEGPGVARRFQSPRVFALAQRPVQSGRVWPERSDGLFVRDAGQLFDDGLVAVQRLEPSAGEKRTQHRTRRLRDRPGWTAARCRRHETAKDGEATAGVEREILRLAVLEAHPLQHLLQLVPGRLRQPTR